MTSKEAIFFRDVTLAISSSLNAAEALEATYHCIRQKVPADEIKLVYFNAESNTVVAVAQAGEVHKLGEIGEAVVIDDALAAFIRETQQRNDPLVVINKSDELPEVVTKYFPYLVTKSILSLSLGIGSDLLGVLIVSSEGKNQYNDEHAKLFRSIRKPVSIAMSNARRYMDLQKMRDRLAEDNRALSADIKRLSGSDVIGAEFGLREVMDMVRRVSSSTSPTLLLGETGSGKEVIANAIHAASPRRHGPLIQMQCGAIPETLLDSELFGHEKGAFTGASDRKRGRFERADGGTLFLDEIGELSSDAQVKLLRVLQEQTFERVGGVETLKVDVRVIAATHRDLDRMVAEGRFREDLWYRLNVFPIRIPPLRLRRDDIPKLAHYFLKKKSQEMNLMSIPRLSQESIARLQSYDWPGNVRELNNIIERSLILSNGRELVVPQLGAISKQGRSGVQPVLLSEDVKTMDQVMAEHILFALERTRGKISGSNGAAALLGLNPSTLRFRIKKLGIGTDF